METEKEKNLQMDLFSLLKNPFQKTSGSPDSSLLRTQTAKETIRLNEKIEVEVRRRSYQRRWNLWVHPTGLIRVTCGKKTPPKALKKWLLQMQPWIEKSLRAGEKLREKYPPKKYLEGECFMYKGQDYRLRFKPGSSSRVSHSDFEIVLGLSPESSLLLKQEKLLALYKKEARIWIPPRVEYWAHCMGLFPSSVSLRGQKTRWGSCSSQGHISLNWKLMAAPSEILDYVVIHELAHLKHQNHSKAFWSLVEAYCAEYKGLRKWLRENQYGFEFLT